MIASGCCQLYSAWAVRTALSKSSSSRAGLITSMTVAGQVGRLDPDGDRLSAVEEEDLQRATILIVVSWTVPILAPCWSRGKADVVPLESRGGRLEKLPDGISGEGPRIGGRVPQDRMKIDEAEAITFHDLAGIDGDPLAELRATEAERMELTPFAAGVDLRREVPPGAWRRIGRPTNRSLNCFGSTQVRTAPVRLPTSAGQSDACRSGGRPERKQRLHARPVQRPDPIIPDVFEEQVAEGHVGDARRPRLGRRRTMRCSYASFVQGKGRGTGTRGRPAAAAWASTSSRRTACIATRSAASLNVVSRPTTSRSGCRGGRGASRR